MPKLYRLSGSAVVNILESFGFSVHSQKGSHVKLRRICPHYGKQTLTIPLHRELDNGTLSAIFRQASQYIPDDQLRPHFYAEG